MGSTRNVPTAWPHILLLLENLHGLVIQFDTIISEALIRGVMILQDLKYPPSESDPKP